MSNALQLIQRTVSTLAAAISGALIVAAVGVGVVAAALAGSLIAMAGLAASALPGLQPARRAAPARALDARRTGRGWVVDIPRR